MKLSELTLPVVKQFLRVDYDFDDDLITGIMAAAKGKILSDTALESDAADNFPELAIGFLELCCDMYDNRSAQTSGSLKPNPSYEQIVALHRRNYL